MKHLIAALLTASLVVVVGCGPSVSSGDDTGDDDDTAGPDASPPTECVPIADTETSCDNDADEDCDERWNCEDPDCSGVGDCPVCGEAVDTEGQPFALPDDGTGTNPYVSTINITGFEASQTLTDIGDFLGVCVNMEHSWLRDLQIELSNPNGTVIVLQLFLGTTGSELFMGVPNDLDTGSNPVPGTGYDYCWTPTAANAPMLDYANANGTHDMPAGDYQAVSGFNGLVGGSLNGAWTIKVLDKWAIDNGFIFSWTIKFSPDLVSDCSTPIG
jgi:subtilisin-like proprotein convertase family protein